MGRAPLLLKRRTWALWRLTSRFRSTHFHSARHRKRPPSAVLHRQAYAVPGGTVQILLDLQENAQWDADVNASTLDRAPHGGTCGSVVWTSSTALIEWLAPDWQQRLVTGASILELGAGVGFVGIALAKMGAARVLMTDLPKQLPLIRKNIAANCPADLPALRRVGCCGFAWGSTLPLQMRRKWDLVVGCDIVYALDQRHAIADTLTELLSRDLDASGRANTRVLLALPDRDDFGYRRRDATGVLSPTLPDYELLLADLEKRMPNSLDVVLLDSIQPKSAEAAHADCGTSVHVMLLSCCNKSMG